MEPSKCDLLYSPPDIIKDFDGFISHICEWVGSRILCNEPVPAGTKIPLYGLATTAITQSGVFPGIGRYTVEEVFVRAGLYFLFFSFVLALISNHIGISVYITTKELFFSPSRLARLIEGYWQWCHESRSVELWWVIYGRHLVG